MIPSAFENLAEHLARGFANRYLGTSFGPTPVARYMGSDDMQALRAVVRKALTEGRNTIGVGRGGDTGVYADYAALGAGGGAGLTGMTSTRASNTNAPSFWERITQITASPITNVAMTVGAAKIVKEGDRVYIEDRYDFDPRTTSKPYVDRLRRGESMRSVLADVAMDQGLGMYGKIRTIAALANDDIGEGNDRVYLGTVDEIMAGASGSDTFRKAPNPFSVSGEPDPDLVARRMQREGETEEQATAWLRSEWSRRQSNTAALAEARGLESSSNRAGVTTPEDFQFVRGAYESPQLPTPEVPQMAGFDFSRRAQALQEKEAYMQRAMQLAGIDAYLSGNPGQLRALQAEYAQLGNERALVAGVNALQAATMGDITPLRQFLANQYGTGNVQIYPMADGTLEIEVDGQSLGRATLADIRQQLLTDLDPATQKQMAVESDRMWEVALLGIKQMLDAQGRTTDIKVLSKPDITVDQSGWYSIGNEVYEIPVIRTTIGGAETKVLGEPVYRGTLQRPQ